MIHNKITGNNLPEFLEELRLLMRKYQFATITGIIASSGTATDFKLKVDQIISITDNDRIEIAYGVIQQAGNKIGQPVRNF